MVPGWEFYNPLQDQVNPLIQATIQSSESTEWTYVDLDGMQVLQVPLSIVIAYSTIFKLVLFS